MINKNIDLIKLNNGFSLVELLIVIAILGILSSIASVVYFGTVSSSKNKFDRELAAQIKNAVKVYLVESEDHYLSILYGVPQDLAVGIDSETFVDKLKNKVEYQGKIYGPYLENVNTKPKGEKTGWEIIISNNYNDVDVFPSDNKKVYLK